MGNPLFNMLGGNMQNMHNAPGFDQMMQQFNQFKASFQGDPKQEVQKLLQSGRMSQQQLDQLQSMARQFQQLIG